MTLHDSTQVYIFTVYLHDSTQVYIFTVYLHYSTQVFIFTVYLRKKLASAYPAKVGIMYIKYYSLVGSVTF